jgi:hypothetical protein
VRSTHPFPFDSLYSLSFALPSDANLFRTAFTDAQETNKNALSGSTAVPAVESDAPAAEEEKVEEKKEEAAPAAEEEPPVYKDEGVAAPVEKAEAAEEKKDEEVKEPVRFPVSLLSSTKPDPSSPTVLVSVPLPTRPPFRTLSFVRNPIFRTSYSHSPPSTFFVFSHPLSHPFPFPSLV